MTTCVRKITLAAFCLPFFFFFFGVNFVVARDSSPGLLDLASVRQASRVITSQAYPDADTVLVDDHVQVVYEADGTSVTKDDTVVKILTEKGRQDNRILSRRFNQSYGSAEFVLVQLLKADGTVQEVDISRQSQAMTDPSQMRSNIYDPNNKVLQVTIPGLEVNDLLRYVLREEIHKPRVPNTFSDYQLLEYTSPIKSFTYDINAPKSLPLQNIVIKSPAPSGTVLEGKEEVGDRIAYRWIANDIPQIFPEPDMPALYTVAQRLLVSTVPRWEDISSWYWQLCEPHAQPTPEMEAKVQELCAGLSDDEAKIRSLFRFVSQEIRYMGITVETEAPGYEPHDVALTFANRHGVCRDKAFLLVVMLRLAGLQAFPVLIHQGPLKDQEVPQPFFNHAITAVLRPDGSYVLMDSTNENTKELLPAYLGNKSYLVARPDGETLRTSPIVPAEENMMLIETNCEIDEKGNLFGTSSLNFVGINDNAYRGMMSRNDQQQRRQFFEAVVKKVAPGAKLTSFVVSPENMQDTNKPLQVEIGFTAPKIMAGDAKTAMLEMPRLAPRVGMVNFILGRASLEKRRFAFLTEMACGVKEKTTVRLHPTWGVPEAIPSYPEVEKETMTWKRKMTFIADTMTMDSEFTVKTVEFEPQQYAELKSDLKIFEAHNRQLPIFDRRLSRHQPRPEAVAPAPASDLPEAESEVIYRHLHYTLLNAREYQLVETMRRKILTYKGMKDNSELHFSFLPSSAQVTLDYARVTNGNVSQEISPAELNEMDAAWVAATPRYPAAKILVASLPGVEVGSVIEYQVTWHYQDQSFFAVTIPFRGFDPVHQMQVVLSAPDNLSLQVATFQDGILGGVKSKSGNLFSAKKASDGKVEWLWSSLRQPAVRRENALPPLSSFVPTVVVSAGNWKEYGQKISEQIAVKAAAGPAISAAVAQLRTLEPQRQVRAVRNLVDKSVRLAGPSFTELPLSSLSAPEQTLADGYGHAADRAILLYFLLRSLKYDPELILAANGPEQPDLLRASIDFPSPGFFSTMLLRLKDGGRMVWLNDTDQYAVLGACRHERKPAMRLNGKTFTIMPDTPFQTRTEKVYDLNLDDQGAVMFLITETMYGMDHAVANKMFSEQTPEERRRYHQALLADLAQSAQANGDLEIDCSSYPGRLSYQAVVPGYAVRDLNRLYFQLPLNLGNLLSLRSDNRQQGLYWPAARHLQAEMRIRLPMQFNRIRLAPKAVTFKPPATGGHISLQAKESKVALIYSYEAFLPAAIIPSVDYEKLLEINRRLHHPDLRTILLQAGQ